MFLVKLIRPALWRARALAYLDLSVVKVCQHWAIMGGEIGKEGTEARAGGPSATLRSLHVQKAVSKNWLSVIRTNGWRAIYRDLLRQLVG